MLIDVSELSAGATLHGDVCIIGGGVAGITLARELAAVDRRVVLLESGPLDFDEAANDLNAGSSIGRPYLDLSTCRQRFLGGTSNHWGGWCLPQDRIDFERGWPFAREELDPFYRRAQPILQLGPYDYEPSNWGIAEPSVPTPFRGPCFQVKILQNSPPTRFRETYGPELRRSDRISVIFGATVTQIAAQGPRITSVAAVAPDRKRIEVQAGTYILACGGIENARLLLLSNLGNDQVGRNFMVHLQCPGGIVAVGEPYTDFGFYTNVTSNGRDYAPFHRRFVSFVGLSEACMRVRNLPNARVMWGFGYGGDIRTIRALQGLTSWRDDHRLSDIWSVMTDLGGAGSYAARRLLGRQALPVASLDLQFTFEPSPCPDSRVRLGDELDALGQRRVALDWRLNPADLDHARTIARLLGAEIGRAGWGRMRSELEDDDWPEGMYGDQHHMGTTTMHDDPTRGAVDSRCRLHGTENLYVAGSSVFPHAGVANPTLTIVALALRLADHLRDQAE